MRSQLVTFMSLVYPFIVGLILISCIPFIKVDSVNQLTLSVFGFSMGLPVNSKLLVRLLLWLGAFTMFALPAFRDYSNLYPTHYDMDVYFDDGGVENSLHDFSEYEMQLLNISKNWKPAKAQYLHNLTKSVASILDINDFFNRGADSVHSTGSTTFLVEKVEGWQRYHIREASGQLTHILELPNEERKQFVSRFELLNTGDNYIQATFSDIYFKYTKILKPSFKQIASLSPAGDKEIYHHSLIACIKIWFFPLCRIGNTVYLIKSEDGKSYIPIGYAVYRPSK